MRQIAVLVTILFLPFAGVAQNSSQCLSESDLLQLQRSSYTDINNLLSSRGWSLEKDPVNQSVDYFGYNLNYTVKKWQIKTTPFFEGMVSLYFKNGLPNLIVYQATNNCFINLLNNQTLTNIDSIYNTLVLRKPGGIVFEFREYLNEISEIRFSVLIYNRNSLQNLIRIETINALIRNGDRFYNQENFEEALSQFNKANNLLNANDNILRNEIDSKVSNCVRRIDINEEINIGDSLYFEMEYLDALSHFQTARNLVNDERESHLTEIIERRIQNCLERINQIEIRKQIDAFVGKGDSLYKNSDYLNAKDQYELAFSFTLRLNPKDEELLNEISIKLGLSDLMYYLKYGDIFYKKGLEFETQLNYEDALFTYKAALAEYKESGVKYKLNPFLTDVALESRIQIGIDSSDYRIERINDWQDTVSFCSQHPKECNELRIMNYNNLNTNIIKSTREGSLNYTAYINFDNKGSYNNYIKINSSSHKRLNSIINEMSFSGITATKKKDYFIPSREDINFDLSWDTKRLRASSKAGRIKISTNNAGSDYNSNIHNFINRQKYTNGVYKFETTEKILNDNRFTDIKLTGYRNNAGPMKFLYSAIMPGWGTSKVTDGEKGTGRTIFFLVTAALSVGSKIYSDIQYDKYKKGTTVSEIEDYYEKADIANKVFLVSGGIAATIYIHDILWVFGKGIKNNNQSRGLRNDLKRGSVKVLESPLKTN
ncbi:hypothetical protein N9164_10345 [Draconibacterium sp.]|nr:hypothetical protein [Draconibacterium sp.]